MPVFAGIGVALGAAAGSTAAAVIGTAVVGAVAGGVYSAATGGNIAKGVIVGGLLGAGAGFAGAALSAGGAGAAGAGTGAAQAAAINTSLGIGGAAEFTGGAAAAGSAATTAVTGGGAGLSLGNSMLVKSGLDLVSGAAKEYAKAESEADAAEAARAAKQHSYMKTDLAQPRFETGNAPSYEDQVSQATDANASMSNYRNYFKPTTFGGISAVAQKKQPLQPISGQNPLFPQPLAPQGVTA